MLTKVYFYKNAYLRMRVNLAFQFVSKSVTYLVEIYPVENKLVEEYAPSQDVILLCDRLVDISNANHSKKYECINSPVYSHIKELHTIILLFT